MNPPPIVFFVRMYRSFLIIALLIYSFNPARALQTLHGAEKQPLSPQDVKTFYDSLRAANQKYLPDYFTVRLSSLAIKAQFRNIPQEMVTFGKKPQLWMYFKKGYRPRLIVRHVASFYQNFFSPYEEILALSGLFFGIDGQGGLDRFTRDFAVDEARTIIEGSRVHLREREGLPGDYGIYFFNKDFLIQRAVFYEAEEEVTEVKWYFGKKDGLFLPKRVLIYLRGSRALTFEAGRSRYEDDNTLIQFSDYQFNAQDYDRAVGL